ncbi:M16 family metallopeptidase [Chloroflexota bacterium]
MYQKTTLDNGLRIVTAAMPHTQSISLSIFVGAGSRHETEAESGISHFIEHLSFRGTRRRPTPQEISKAIEGVGGILNASTDRELTVYWCKVARKHFDLALDVLADMVLHSRFAAEDIAKESQIITEEINMGKDSPAQYVNILIDELLWPHHPLGRDIAGSKESVAAMTRDMMLGYMNGHYLPAGTVIAVAGNVRHQETVEAVSRVLGGWTGQLCRAEFLPYEEQPGPRLRIEARDTEQAHLCLALPGLAHLHPRRFVLDLLNVILGEGMSSRLFSEIRDKLGLAYSIHSYVEHLLDTGSMVVYAGVEPRRLPEAVSAILGQLGRLKEGVPQSELDKAKEQSKGRLLLRMEDSRSVAGWIGGQEILTERILGMEQVLSIIDAITVDELGQLAGELLMARQLRLAVVGPVSDSESLEGLLEF